MLPKPHLPGILFPIYMSDPWAHRAPVGLILPRSFMVLNRAEKSLEGRVQISYVTTDPISQTKGSLLSWSLPCTPGALMYMTGFLSQFPWQLP